MASRISSIKFSHLQIYKMTELFQSNRIKTEFKEKNWIKFRPLNREDFQKWFCSVLSELTSCETDELKFKEIFNEMYEINTI